MKKGFNDLVVGDVFDWGGDSYRLVTIVPVGSDYRHLWTKRQSDQKEICFRVCVDGSGVRQ